MRQPSILFILLIIIALLSCDEEPTEPEQLDDFIPELILIDNDLTFTMGNSWGDPVEQNEIPAHTVQLSPYYIGKYEVTNEEYLYFVKDNGYMDSSYWSSDGWKLIKELNMTRPMYWDSSDTPWSNFEYSDKARTPITGIFWWGAEAYCRWLSKKTEENYSLPTEAQWERAARGPDPGRKFPWGNVNDFSKYNDIGYFAPSLKTEEVGSYPTGKSYDGCYDMSGNAFEYCKDWADSYANSYYEFCYEQGTVINPQGPEGGKNKSVRGVQNMLSAIYEESREITTTRRFIVIVYNSDGTLYKSADQLHGFRVVKKYE
ncbi:MAG: SUMF1/EgtB/PvdO family nonheme iron enzyme [Ignavibacteria bacterium]|jgi:formylglycine-generating enzyme required for sulfatase activity